MNENDRDPLRPDTTSVFFTDDAPETAPAVVAAAAPPEPVLPLSSHFSRMTRLGVAYSVMALLFLIVGYLGAMIIVRLVPDPTSAWWADWVLSIVPLYAVALPVLLLLIRPVTTSPYDPVGQIGGVPVEKKPIRAGHWLLLFVVSAGCMYIGSLISTWLMDALSALTGRDYADILQSMTMDAPLWLVTLCTVVAAPIGEEFIFRKLLIDRTRRYGDIAAILLSASFFALFHRNVFQFFYTFFIGAVLAYAYTRFGKYWVCVSLHAACNFIGGVWPKFLQEQVGPEALGSTEAMLDVMIEKPLIILAVMLQSLIMYGSIVAAVVLLIVYRKKLCLSRGTQGLTRSETARAVALNAGSILFAVICIALTVLSMARM